MKTLYWLIKRELWEHRNGFLWTPLGSAVLFLLLNLIGIVAFHQHYGLDLAYPDPDMSEHSTETPADLSAALILSAYAFSPIIRVVLGFVVFFYCLGALYDDRRDRSLLFWKSLPLSDSKMVLSKLIIALVVAPLIALLTHSITGMLLLLLSAITLTLHGLDAWELLRQAHPLHIFTDAIGLVPRQLWALPTIGWLLLCSAWARSKPLLWALALPAVAGLIARSLHLMDRLRLPHDWYWRHIFVRLLGGVFPSGRFPHGSHAFAASHVQSINLQQAYRMLSSLPLWLGVAAGMAMITAAIWLRRWRDDV